MTSSLLSISCVILLTSRGVNERCCSKEKKKDKDVDANGARDDNAVSKISHEGGL